MAELAKEVGFAMLIAFILAFVILMGVRQCARPQPAPIAAQRDTIQQRDTVFVHDTARVAQIRTVYRAIKAPITARKGVVGADTVLKLIAVTDTLASTDSTAIENCARLVQAQKKLIASLVPPAPRLDYFIQPMYSLADGDIIVQGGAEYRVFDRVSLVAGAQVGQQRALFVGARITFR